MSLASIEKLRAENDMIFRHDRGVMLTNGEDYRFFQAAKALSVTCDVLCYTMTRNGMSTHGASSRYYVRMPDLSRLSATLNPEKLSHDEATPVI